MTTLHAQPYDMTKKGFYFESFEEYEAKAEASGAEEFEIQFIDGDDYGLFNVCGICQINIKEWFEEVETLQDYEKAVLFYLCGDLGESLAEGLTRIDEVSYSEGTLEEVAEQLFDDCYEVPKDLAPYIDYEKFARDCRLGGDLCEFVYQGTTYTVTNANCL